MAIKIAVAGIQGRMGRAIEVAVATNPRFTFVGGFGRITDMDETSIARSAAIDAADVILDFTVGSAAAELASLCAANGAPALVIGATGFEAFDLARIKEAARLIPIVRSGNFSIGLNRLAFLVNQAAKAFPSEIWDIEILEAHHRSKVDAPSGTALMLGEAAARGRGVALASVERRGRDGITGERPTAEIGFSVMRGGGIVGNHSVLFASADEVVTLSHSALDRGMFARGALAAAQWVLRRSPGEYDMDDVLGVSPQSAESIWPKARPL